MKDVATRAEKLARDVVETEGLELVHVEYHPGGATPVLRVYIDKPGGVNLSDCQETSRQLSVLLDVEDFIPSHYTLEVSSPGLERPLFTEEDYRRFRGREIRLTTTEKIENRRNHTGNIAGFADGLLELESEGRIVSIPFQKIRKANLVYRFT